MDQSSTTSARHHRILFWSSLGAHVVVAALVYLSSFLPAFDASASAILPPHTPRLVASLLRWDAFHFGAVAVGGGYVYEHQWAFLPGLPAAMRVGAWLARNGNNDGDDGRVWPAALVAGSLGAFVCSSLAPHTLYALTLHHFRSRTFALLAALLSLIPGSPATAFFAPYTEPYFAYLSYEGMLACARGRYVRAAVAFAAATAFRSNGVMLAGYILYDLVAEPILRSRRAPPLSAITKSAVLTLVVVSPFLWHQWNAYRLFCVADAVGASRPAWCADAVPSIYAYAQATYWNVGFLRYWTPAQLPNILLAAPLLTLLLSFSLSCLQHTLLPLILSTKPHTAKLRTLAATPTLLPHAIHTTVLALVLLFAAHTQIALRIASALPTTYWAAAYLLIERPALGRGWIVWSVVWGALSVVLWTAFLPPA